MNTQSLPLVALCAAIVGCESFVDRSIDVSIGETHGVLAGGGSDQDFLAVIEAYAASSGLICEMDDDSIVTCERQPRMVIAFTKARGYGVCWMAHGLPWQRGTFEREARRLARQLEERFGERQVIVSKMGHGNCPVP
jgi:hypothetical protein